MSKGFITLDRKILNHWIIDDPLRFRAWIIILMSVNYKDSKTLINGNLVECKRGEALFSLDTWSKKLNMSKQQTRTFLNLLKTDKMIELKGLSKTTRLNVINYNTYQIEQHTDNTQITHKQHSDNIQITSRVIKNNKDNKENNNISKGANKLFRTFLDEQNLNKETFIALFKSKDKENEFNDDDLISDAFNELYDWSNSNNKKKADWISTLRNWIRRKKEMAKPNYNNKPNGGDLAKVREYVAKTTA